MRIAALVGALVLIGCSVGPSPAPEPARCPPRVPETAQHPIAIRSSSLAGEYDLIQVQSQPASGVATTGRLHLAPLDSSARAEAVGGPARDLIGRLELDRSTGRESIEAVLAGQHLRLGHPAYGDGVIQNLTITAAVVTEPATGRVVPDPAGYFCALRRDANR